MYYVVEAYADAPMRARAAFETRDDAEAYASRIGDCLIRELPALIGEAATDALEDLASARGTARMLERDVAGLTAENAELTRELDRVRAALRSAEQSAA